MTITIMMKTIIIMIGNLKLKICEKLLDSETCKKIEEELKSKTKKLSKEEIQEELKSKTKKLSKEEIQEEQIRSKYLEPVDPNQNTINNIEQTNENTQIGNAEPMQNEIIKSDANPQNLSSHSFAFSSFSSFAYKYYRFFQHFPLPLKSEYSRSKSTNRCNFFKDISTPKLWKE